MTRALVLALCLGSSGALAQGARLLVLDVQPQQGVSADEGAAVHALVTDALRGRERLLVATSDDVRQRAPMQADRVATCDAELCLHELADALDAEFVLFGKVGAGGEGRVVELGLFDARAGEIVVAERVEGSDVNSLAPFVGAAMDRLLAPVLAEARPIIYEQPLFLLGTGVTAVGLLLAAGAGGWALELESTLHNPDAHRELKERALAQGPLLLGATAVGVGVFVVGAALIGTSFAFLE